MSSTQKLIKYVAVLFGLLLSFSIIFSIVECIGGIFRALINTDNSTFETRVISEDFNDTINDIDIDLSSSNLIIKKGDKVLVESNSKSVKYKIDGTTLKIKDSKSSLVNGTDSSVIVYIPDDVKLDKLNIDIGAGYLTAESVNVKKLDLNLGAGSTTIDNLISDDTDIDTGAGSFTINSGSISNLDLDIGVGRTVITAGINGNSSIDTGIGSLTLNLPNSGFYTFDVDKGLGRVIINDDEIFNDKIVGDGINTIRLSGGIGDIIVNFDK